MDSYVGYTNTCRICLKKDELMHLTILDIVNDAITYGDMLKLILHPVPIDMNSKLPQKICEMCKDNLVKVFNLRQLCFTSDRWIKSTIYGDLYLNANGLAISPAPNDNSVVETMCIDSGDYEPGSIATFFLSSIQYATPEVILQDNFEQELQSDNKYSCTIKEQLILDQREKEKRACEICHLKFSTLTGFLRHKVKKHNVDINTTTMVKCELCSVAFANSRGLKSHYLSLKHIQKEQGRSILYNCKKCTTEFVSIEEYSKHMLKHMVIRMDIKNSVCQVCGSVYTSKRNLRRHQLKHLNNEI